MKIIDMKEYKSILVEMLEYFDKKCRENNDKYLLCVANYFNDKNQELVLESFYMSNIDKNIKLVFVGSEKTKYYNYLLKYNEKLRKKYGDRKIEFLVGIDRNTTIRLIKNSLIYLFGSKHEVFPLSIVEPMASGVPFISTDVGCVRALPGGFIINNKYEMSYFIELLTKDKKLNEELGKLGREYSNQYLRTKDKVNLLNELINNI